MLFSGGATRMTLIMAHSLSTSTFAIVEVLFGTGLSEVGAWASRCISGLLRGLGLCVDRRLRQNTHLQRAPLGLVQLRGTPLFWKTQNSGRSVPVDSMKPEF